MCKSTPLSAPPAVGIEWKRLKLSVANKKGETKEILKGCDGFLPAGRLLAVMGPSGSGKTSFLNVLADRTPVAKGMTLTGEVAFGGVPREKIPAFHQLASYVLQDDSLYPMLTVFETLLLAARFRLPKSMPLADKIARVEQLIDELGLRSARDTLIGDDRHKGVSGGERKRVSVGVEIIGDPSIVFLDEPTSGLDAFQAQNVMRMLTGLVKRGRTVVVSIHQPRSSIYAMFDRLLLFSSGNVMYNGEASTAVAYFANVGHACPVHFNPADFFIDLVSVDTQSSDKGAADNERILAIATAAEKARLEGDGGALDVETGERQSVLACAELSRMEGGCACTGRYHSSLMEQFWLLFLRSLRSRVRDKAAIILPICGSVFFSLVVGALFSEMSLGQKSIQDRTGALFFVCINQAFGGVFGVINTFPAEKKIVDRERTSGAYAVLPYYLAKWLAEFPFAATGPIVFACIAYWVIGFVASAGNFLTFVGIIVAINVTAVSWGMLISSAASSVQQASAIGPLVIIVFLLFGGFYANTDNIPDWLSWISEVSFFKWGFKAMALNEYSDLVFVNDAGVPCDHVAAASTLQAGGTSLPTLLGLNGTVNATALLAPCAFVNGKQVLELLTFGDGSVGQCIAFLLITAAAVHATAYFCLSRFNATKFASFEASDARAMPALPATIQSSSAVKETSVA